MVQMYDKMNTGAGVILTRIRNDGIYEVLLLEGAESGIWSFSKGHPELTDRRALLRTAARETYEETGYICGQDYTIVGPSSRVGKHPYWVGITNGQKQPELKEREHRSWAWMTRAEVAALPDTTINTDVRAWLRRTRSNDGWFSQTLVASGCGPRNSMHWISQECIAS